MAIPQWKRGIQQVNGNLVYYSSPTVTATAIQPVKTLDKLKVQKGTLVSTPTVDYTGNVKKVTTKKKTTNTEDINSGTKIDQPSLDLNTQLLIAGLSGVPFFGEFAKLGAGWAAKQYEQQTGQPFYTVAPYVAPAAITGQAALSGAEAASDAVSGLLPDWKKLAVIAAAVLGGAFILTRR